MQNARHIGYVVCRAVALIGLLVWVLSSLVNSSRVGLLLLFASVIVFWLCFSALIDYLWPAAAGAPTTLRGSVFGMIDLYMAVTFLIILHDKVVESCLVVAAYAMAVTVLGGVPVGVVSAISGAFAAFNSKDLASGAGFIPMIMVFGSGMAGSGVAYALELLRKRLAGRAQKKALAAAEAARADEAAANPVATREELEQKLRILQENFDKVCQERDQLLEQVSELESKVQAGKPS